MKDIKDITEKEVVNLLIESGIAEDPFQIEVRHEPKKLDAGIQISWSGDSTGIVYKDLKSTNVNDGFLVPFTDSRVMVWLLDHDFDVSELIRANVNNSKEEIEFENTFQSFYNLAFDITQGAKYTEDPVQLKKVALEILENFHSS